MQLVEKLLFTVLFLSLAFVGGFELYLNSSTRLDKREIFIPQGSNKKVVSHLQKKEGINLTFIDAYILSSYGGAKSGFVRFSSNNIPRRKFLKELAHPTLLMQNLLFIPGETTHFFFKSIATKLNLSYDKLMDEYKKLSPYSEGVILADTYRVAVNMKEKGVVAYLLKFSIAKHKRLAKKYFGDYDQKSWFKKITIASIIQKEAGSIAEMPKISSVIYNRIQKGMKLQMDGTLNYGKYSHTKITSSRIKTDSSNYNTYKIEGLPKNPVSCVQIEAIDAAINPTKTKYLYFVKGKANEHIFATTYQKHLSNIHRK